MLKSCSEFGWELNINDVYEYLGSEWRSNRDIKKHFNLNQQRFYHLSRWLIRGGFIECRTSYELNFKNLDKRINFYRVKVKNNNL
jgi:hypothetical protein